MSDDIVLDVRDLHTHFHLRRGIIKVVDGISFSLRRKEVLGLVGESGCGKSMTALSLLRLIPKPAARTVRGEILLDGENILTKSSREMEQIRGSKISMILQDPQTSLNPVFTIGDQLRESIVKQFPGPNGSLTERIVDALRKVKVAAPETRIHQYPHQLSGGMKQRVVGAIAIARAPKVLIADEPTTALDVTIQLQYLKLLKELQESSDMAIIFITHDFGIVAKMCDRVAVMYAGRIVESGPVREVFDDPRHPYTQALIASVPKMRKQVGRLPTIEGQPPAFSDLPQGCRFAPRCPMADARCQTEYPRSFAAGKEHTADCWRLETAT